MVVIMTVLGTAINRGTQSSQIGKIPDRTKTKVLHDCIMKCNDIETRYCTNKKCVILHILEYIQHPWIVGISKSVSLAGMKHQFDPHPKLS